MKTPSKILISGTQYTSHNETEVHLRNYQEQKKEANCKKKSEETGSNMAR
jgi:hypothetical protein